MPIYEYVCTKCGAETEALQKFDEKPLTQCEVCKKRGLERKLSLSAFHLQGGGWFREGYGAGNEKSTKKGTEAANDSSASTATKDSGSSAPAAKDSGGASSSAGSSAPAPAAAGA